MTFLTLSPIVIIYIASVILALCIGWIIRLEMKVKKLVAGKNGASLEDAIIDAHTKINNLSEFRKDSLSYFGDVEERLNRSIQAVETIRFNPFKGTGEGGNQSFSTAFINQKGNGVVLSSMYSRDRVSIFSKPVQKYNSEFELTEEEKNVIEEAKQHLKK